MTSGVAVIVWGLESQITTNGDRTTMTNGGFDAAPIFLGLPWSGADPRLRRRVFCRFLDLF
jgi:hypothetical protein